MFPPSLSIFSLSVFSYTSPLQTSPLRAEETYPTRRSFNFPPVSFTFFHFVPFSLSLSLLLSFSFSFFSIHFFCALSFHSFPRIVLKKKKENAETIRKQTVIPVDREEREREKKTLFDQRAFRRFFFHPPLRNVSRFSPISGISNVAPVNIHIFIHRCTAQETRWIFFHRVIQLFVRRF